MAKRFKVGFKKKINIPRVVAKVSGVIIALYIGNEIINQIGSIVNGSQGPFNQGFKLIGWTVGGGLTNGTAGSYYADCISGTIVATQPTNCVTAVSGAGILAVIGVIGIASIVMEFVQFNM